MQVHRVFGFLDVLIFWLPVLEAVICVCLCCACALTLSIIVTTWQMKTLEIAVLLLAASVRQLLAGFWKYPVLNPHCSIRTSHLPPLFLSFL